MISYPIGDRYNRENADILMIPLHKALTFIKLDQVLSIFDYFILQNKVF